MAARMTAEMWLQGANNALVCVTLALPLFGTLTLGISVFMEQNLWDSAEIVFCLFWIVVLLAVTFEFVRGRVSSGPVLLDCGPTPIKFLYLFVASTFALNGLLNLGTSGTIYTFPGYLFWFSGAAFYLLLGTGRVQLCENGIRQNGNLLRWAKIKSYEWNGAPGSALKLQMRTWLTLVGKVIVLVPDEHKEECCRLLDERGVVRISLVDSEGEAAIVQSDFERRC